MQQPRLLTTTHETFQSALAALRPLAPLLPDDPRAVQAAAGTTQLGMVLWLCPGAADLLQFADLASQIEANLQLRRQLGISDAETCHALLQNNAVLAPDLKRAEAMLAHLQHLQARGALSSDEGAVGRGK